MIERDGKNVGGRQEEEEYEEEEENWSIDLKRKKNDWER